MEPMQGERPQPTPRERLAVTAFDDIALQGDFEVAWRQLASHAAAANPFYEPVMAMPAGAYWPGVRLWAWWRGDRLAALVPFEFKHPYGRWPLQWVEAARHPHLFLAAPLVWAGEERRFAAAFLRWLDKISGAAAVSLPVLPTDGGVGAALLEVAHSQGRALDKGVVGNRAMVDCRGDFDAYQRDFLSANRRKKLRAKTRRLCEHGDVSREVLQNASDIDAWYKEFLRIEDGGWKGEAGTAINCDRLDRTFFNAVVRRAFEEGRLRFSRLNVGQGAQARAVAYSLDIVSNGVLFALKIAHDVDFERYSPGFLLEAANIEAAFKDPEINEIDSCAAPDHPVLSGFATHTRPIGHLVISRCDLASRVQLTGLKIIGGVKEMLARAPNLQAERRA